MGSSTGRDRQKNERTNDDSRGGGGKFVDLLRGERWGEGG